MGYMGNVKNKDENNMDGKLLLNIAMVGHKRMPSREGGIEVVVEELATRMVFLGHSVTCYNRKGHHISGSQYDSEKHKEYKGVKIRTVPTINRRGLAAMTSSVFGAFFVALGKYDVVHFHAEGSCAMLWLPRLRGKRCIVTIHGLDHKRAKWGRLAKAYIMQGEKCAVKYADEIIVLSKNTQQYFYNTYRRITRYIPNGVNRPQILPANRIKEKYGLQKDSYFLFVGRLVPEKGIQYLVDAFKKIHVDRKLVIAGGISDSDDFLRRLKNMARGDKRIIFTGFVQGEELEELYSNAYVYVLPSDLEGMPLSLLEAMSYGNCCLVSDIPECMEIIEDRGLSFRKADAEDLKDKIQYICSNEEQRKYYKDIAADYVCKKYCWDDVVEKTLGLYKGKVDRM